MYKEILEALRTKFNGVSDAILSKMATKLAKTASTSEEVATAVEGVTFQQIIDAEADRRATEASATAVSNYEKKHHLKDGKVIENNGGGENPKPRPTPAPSEGGNDVPAWAQSLIEANKALTDRLNSIDASRVTANRQEQLSSIIGKLPENLRKPYSRMDVGSLSEEDFSTLLTEVNTEVEGITADLMQKGVVIGQPKGGSGEQPTSQATAEETKAVADMLNI